jgi:hypothetical protein
VRSSPGTAITPKTDHVLTPVVNVRTSRHPPGHLAGSGTYLSTQRLDVTLILRAPGRTLVAGGATATLDGTDVTARLVACLVPGVIPSGGQSFRCGALTDAHLAARARLAPPPIRWP